MDTGPDDLEDLREAAREIDEMVHRRYGPGWADTALRLIVGVAIVGGILWLAGWKHEAESDRADTGGGDSRRIRDLVAW